MNTRIRIYIILIFIRIIFIRIHIISNLIILFKIAERLR